jgi:hypothetical protein
MKELNIRFQREVPQIEGMSLIVWLDSYGVFSVTEAIEETVIELNVPMQEISEDEALNGTKFYGVSRDYRSTYSEVEGLEPDEEGGYKTKVYHTDDTRSATLSLMKKISKRRVEDEYARRDDVVGKESVLQSLEDAASIWDINILRENLLGVEMPMYQAMEMGLADQNKNRTTAVDYNKGF